MDIDIREIEGDVKIEGKTITINNGSILLSDGTIIRSGNVGALSSTKKNNQNSIGKILCEEFEVRSFSTLVVNSYLNIDFSIGEKPKVFVEATKDIVDNIVVENIDTELHIDVKEGFDDDMRDIVVKVVTPRLSKIVTYNVSTVNILTPIKNKGTIMLVAHEGSKITLASVISPTVYLSVTEGATLTVKNIEAETSTIVKVLQGAHLSITDRLKTTNLYTNTEQAAIVNMYNIESKQIVAKSGGASTVKFSGQADNVEYVASGRSNISAEDLTALNGKATTTELARIKCNITEHFEKHSSILAKIINRQKY